MIAGWKGLRRRVSVREFEAPHDAIPNEQHDLQPLTSITQASGYHAILSISATRLVEIDAEVYRWATAIAPANNSRSCSL